MHTITYLNLFIQFTRLTTNRLAPLCNKWMCSLFTLFLLFGNSRSMGINMDVQVCWRGASELQPTSFH